VAFYRRIAVPVLLLGSWCFGQVQLRFNDGPRKIKDVLDKAHLSGSIVYSYDCKVARSRFPVPPNVYAPRSAGSPVEVLRQMFSGHSEMQVTQDPSGIVRIVQRDVPTDILDVKIRHIVFPPRTSDPYQPNEPDRALLIILSSPEVLSFEKERDIVPPSFRLDGIVRSDLPSVPGELRDVTLSQALDYVLKTLPGYWIYENCTTEDGRRTVNFRFY
jgi:hypothetical protein